jgi:hypothetical protein
MILLHDVAKIARLPDDDRRPVGAVVASDGGCIGLAAVNGDRLGYPVAAEWPG